MQKKLQASQTIYLVSTSRGNVVKFNNIFITKVNNEKVLEKDLFSEYSLRILSKKEMIERKEEEKRYKKEINKNGSDIAKLLSMSRSLNWRSGKCSRPK